jgi:hypothetical protein
MALSSVHVGKLTADPVKGDSSGPVARFTVVCPVGQQERAGAGESVLVEVETSGELADEVLATLRADDEVIVVGQLGGTVRAPAGQGLAVRVLASYVALELAAASARRPVGVPDDPRQPVPVGSSLSELPWSW